MNSNQMKDNTTDWVAICVNIVFAVISVVFSISSCHHSEEANRSAQKANDASEKQASAAILEHQPYVAIVSHSDNGNKQHGIYIHNYASGLAIIDSIIINREENPKLTTEKWKQILTDSGFTNAEIACFSFSMPYKGIGLSGNNTVPFIFVSSENEKNIENSGGISLCNSEEILSKLERNLDIKINYKSRFSNSEVKTAQIFRLWN
ncbi:TPA: hypothetical protein ACTC28_000608 [Neisseria meningitidis]